jgi:thiol-disulfide isomerase/thioredoxin
MQSLRGKVIVVDFWTYTCINCIRTLPYVKTWWAKYKDKGLVIVGVHTPEFEFEKNADNVAKAIKDFGIEYPVMQDNNYATWNAFTNQYWPAEYFIDKNGKIRFTHFGEGNYNESEGYIQTLLAETGVTNEPKINNAEYQIYAETPETYVGYNRMAGISEQQTVQPDKIATYTLPTSLSANTFAFGGGWNVGAEQTIPSSNATLSYHFSAKNVYLVMRPHAEGATAKVTVVLDGKDVGASAGSDVKNGVVTVDTDRLYTLINLAQPGDHTVTLQFQDGNAELFAFTFG